MRKVAVAGGIVILLIILGIAIFASTFDINRYRGTIQADLSQHLGRNVTVGNMNLNLFPPRFVVHDVTIADDPSFHTQRPFVETQELAVSVKLLPLIHKSVEIDSLSLQRPHVELVKDAQGRWNFSTLGKTASAPSGAPPQPAASGQQQLSLSKLEIQDGQIATTDEQAHQPRSIYNHIDVTLRDFAPGKPFSIEAAAHLPGPNDQQIHLAGDGGPIPEDPAATPFHGTLELQRVAISSARSFVNSPALAKFEGSVSGQTKISSDAGKLSATGNLTIENAKMNGQAIAFPIKANYDIHDDLPADLLTVSSATMQLGNTPLLISGTVNSKPTPAQIDLSLQANNVSIADAEKLAAASGTAFTPGATIAGSVNLNVQARGAATAPAFNGTIVGRDIQVGGKNVPQPVQVKEVALHLTPAEIRSDPFTVSSGATSASVQLALQQYTSKTPIINATVQASNAELPAVLAMAKAYGVAGFDKVSGSGTMNVDLHATGPVQSLQSNDISRDLNGTVSLNFHDVKYSGADMGHELSSIAGLFGVHQENQGTTTINQLKGNITVKNGVADTNDMEALLDIGNVGITGTANLVNQQLNLRVSAVMSKELSQKAGGTNIGGYAKTALANSDGDLVIPATVTGTFDHPRFAPDVQQIAQMKLKGLVPNFNNPAAAVSGLLGNLGDSQQKQPAANAIRQLQNLFGKKQQKQPSR